jgi:hypothetical protein
MSVKYDCDCIFCHGEACSSCPDCLPRIYEHDHPGMETFGLGSFPAPIESARYCFKCGETTPPGGAPKTWWPVELPGRTEWLCSERCVYLAYPWKMTGQRATPRHPKLSEHIANPATFSTMLESMMRDGE